MEKNLERGGDWRPSTKREGKYVDVDGYKTHVRGIELASYSLTIESRWEVVLDICAHRDLYQMLMCEGIAFS